MFPHEFELSDNRVRSVLTEQLQSTGATGEVRVGVGGWLARFGLVVGVNLTDVTEAGRYVLDKS